MGAGTPIQPGALLAAGSGFHRAPLLARERRHAPARQVAHTTAYARPEQSVAGSNVEVFRVYERARLGEVGLLHLCLKDDGDDDSVDGDRLAEDDAAAAHATSGGPAGARRQGGCGHTHRPRQCVCACGACREPMAKLWRRQREAAAHLIRFLERMRGARTAAPSRDEPVMKMPQAAPSTDRPMARPAPTKANRNGSRSASTLPQSS